MNLNNVKVTSVNAKFASVYAIGDDVTLAPTTTTIPTTTIAPTTTLGPTTAPISTTSNGTLTVDVVGDSSKLPSPVVNNSVVLFTSSVGSVASTVPISFFESTTVPKDAIIQQAQVTFFVTFISKPATVVVTFRDEYGDVAGSVSAQVNNNGTVSVDISNLYSQILAENQKSIVIRAIRGSILKASLSVETTDVPVNLDISSGANRLVYVLSGTTIAPTTSTTVAPTTTLSPTTSTAVVSTTSASPSTTMSASSTTLSPQTVIPTTTKPSVSAAAALGVALCIQALLFLAVM